MDVLFIATLAVSLVVLIVLVVLVLHHSPVKKLQRKLRSLQLSLHLDPASLVKEVYLTIYNHYLKLSEKKKSRFYAEVVQIRGALEEQLASQKKLDVLISQVDRADARSKKLILDEIQEHYQKVSAKDREKYISVVTHLRQQVEKGSN